MTSAQQALKARQMVARGKRLCVRPLDPTPHYLRALKGRKSIQCMLAVAPRPFRAKSFYFGFPGAARKAACPWLPSAAPSALVDLRASLINLRQSVVPAITQAEVVLLRAEFMNSFDERNHIFDGSFGENPMAKVENMTRPPGCLVKNLFRLRTDVIFPRK